MKKIKDFFKITSLAILGLLYFTSCSDDDGGNGGDFIEVTFVFS